MSTLRLFAAAAAAAGLIAGCASGPTLPAAAGYGPDPQLPAPRSSLIPVVNIADAVGWPAGVTPTPAQGLQVNAFATGLDHPRWLYRLPNGDILVAESNAPPRPPQRGIRAFFQRLIMGRAGANAVSANRITLLRDADGDGVAETRTVFLENLFSPFGMTLVGDTLYVANADALVSVPYQEGQTRITAPPTRVLALPAGVNHHWTKNVIASPDGRRLYITVGSNSNVGEKGMAVEEGRAAIWEYDIGTGRHRIFASGLRNPNGLDWNPENGALWTAVNERDEIGNDLVPDYMTSVRDGGFYGWPYSYYGQIVDTRVRPQRPDLVARAIRPDYALGAHTASLGLAFYTADLMPQFRNGVLIGQHGSWNRAEPSGYKVVFIPFANGRPNGPPQDVLTGFLDPTGEQARGRPVGVIVDRAGAILVADDVGNVIWRVAPSRSAASAAGASSG